MSATYTTLDSGSRLFFYPTWSAAFKASQERINSKNGLRKIIIGGEQVDKEPNYEPGTLGDLENKVKAFFEELNLSYGAVREVLKSLEAHYSRQEEHLLNAVNIKEVHKQPYEYQYKHPRIY